MSAGSAQWVQAGGLRWHLHQQGQGPVALLLHGTGASLHSWRPLAPWLHADGWRVIAPDLPGHGQTQALPRHRCSLPGMAEALAALLAALGEAPQLVIGHSAGAALSAQWALDHPPPALRQLVWVAGALQPLPGLAGRVAPALARWAAGSRWVPRWAARHARDPAAVERLIRGTGSRLDAPSLQAYGELWRQPDHVAGTLAMMAGWDLAPLQPRLARLAWPVLLLHGSADRTVPPAESDAVAAWLPQARVRRLPGLGHLAHEQAPERLAALVRQALDPKALDPLAHRVPQAAPGPASVRSPRIPGDCQTALGHLPDT